MNIVALCKLVRPHQWLKSIFVAVGPLYALTAPETAIQTMLRPLLGAVTAFALASSACYIINDLQDREADRAHPRKRHRPIASGAVTPGAAAVFAALLVILAFGATFLVPAAGDARLWLMGLVAVYIANVSAYSLRLKHMVIVDVMSLATGFVLRVLAGCAATLVEPSTWLLNSAFFLAMFLSFGKRLGERRTVAVGGGDITSVRPVQGAYTDDLLRMVVVVTGVAVLVTYAGYVQAHAAAYTFGAVPAPSLQSAAADPPAVFAWGFNLLWITMIPATYALLRCILMLERGRFDDPTELAAHDRPFQLAALAFAAITISLVVRAQ